MVAEVPQAKAKPGLKVPPESAPGTTAQGESSPLPNAKDDSSTETEKDENPSSASEKDASPVSREITDSPSKRVANVSKEVQAAVLPPGVHTMSTASSENVEEPTATTEADKPSATVDDAEPSDVATEDPTPDPAATKSPDPTSDQGKPAAVPNPLSNESGTSHPDRVTGSDKVIAPGSRLFTVAQTEPRFQTDEYEGVLDITWADIFSNSIFVERSHIGVPPDAILVALAQFKLCTLTADDRIGRYKHQEIGWVGICCRYCYGQPG